MCHELKDCECFSWSASDLVLTFGMKRVLIYTGRSQKHQSAHIWWNINTSSLNSIKD